MKRGRIFFNKSGQIWVETMVYTLIAFALIGLVLAFVKPRIEEIQDRGIIEQSVEVLNDIDFVIKNLGGPGNQRVIELGLQKGTLTIDGQSDTLFFVIESRYEYSQPGQDINVGSIVARTEQKGKEYDVTLTKDYSGTYNLRSDSAEAIRQVSRSPTPYIITISDQGNDASGNKIINIQVTTS